MFRFADSSVMKWLKVSDAALALGNEPTPAQMYAALEFYYLNNGLYDAVAQSMQESGIWTEAMKGLRNPAFRVVEFYVSKIWAGQLPDSLPILAENDAIVDPIHQIWEWSNWSHKKQVFSRWFAMFGDVFAKTATRNDVDGNPSRVYFQLIRPLYVTDFDVDERGFLTEIRLDIPQVRTTSRGQKQYIYTEYWSKSSQMMLTFEHDKPIDTPIEKLGSPKETASFSEFGIDFVPFVHAKFIDIGDDRGLGSFAHALDKIDELNRMATRLHQMLFRYNKPIFALSANSLDASGRPLPPPRIGNENAGTETSDRITIADDVLFRLPGMSKLEAMIPTVDYAAYIAEIGEQTSELERDLPELAYYRLREKSGDLSGRAVRLLLTDAIDRAIEARGNAESALARLDSMALTIAKNIGLDGFENIGNYENGDFDHKFATRDVIPLSETEKNEIIKTAVDAGIPLETAARRAGWSQDEIDKMLEDKKKEQKAAQDTFAQSLLENQRRFDQGNNFPNGSPEPPDEDNPPE